MTHSADTVLVQMGGVGDLVLLASAAAALRRARPGTRLVLLCRQPLAALPALWPVPPDEVVGLTLDPARFEAPTEVLRHALAAVALRLRDRRAGLLVDAAVRPGWFTPFLAGLLQAETALCCPGAPVPVFPMLGRLMAAELGLAERPVAALAPPPRLAERARHDHWLAAVGAGPAEPVHWTLPAPLATQALDWLQAAGLQPGGYLACSPGGAELTRLKRWPEERFATVLREAGLPVLLLGTTAERPLLEQLGHLLGQPAVACLTGEAAELPLAAALLAQARGWLGNDSGPMHLGQAYGVPGVAIFGGGGAWPAYRPWAPGSVGVHCPLPCQGCDWDCLLDHAMCIDRVPAEAVLAALRRCLAQPGAPPEVVALAGPPAPVMKVLAAASESYRAAQRDRASRLEDGLAATAVAAQHAARAAGLEAALATTQQELAVQSQAAAERLAVLEMVNEAAEERLRGVRELTVAVAEREARLAALARAVPRPVAWQVSVGLGAGNIGDELMAEAFWRQLPPSMALDVPLFPQAALRQGGYPPPHCYLAVDYEGNENAGTDLPGLLVGATPVAEAEGLHFPLRFLQPRLAHFHRRGLPVDAVGVGVEPLASAEARAIFADAFLPIRSWTVRSDACRAALLALGVRAEQVRVGADWAWLHTPAQDLRDWAADWWRRHGIDPARPLLVANVVAMQWPGRDAALAAMAEALDAAARRHGLQLACLANDCRDGDFFDQAAARRLAAMLRHPAVLLPNLYYSPDQAMALLSHATLTLGERYHFAVQSVLAGSLPLVVPRGAKLRGLVAELGLLAVGDVTAVAPAALRAALDQAMAERPRRLANLALRQRELRLRAAGNLALLRALPPYAGCWPAAAG